LLLFVISALVTGMLILGKPILLYLNNSKEGAISFLLYTLAWLVLFAVLLIVAMLVLQF